MYLHCFCQVCTGSLPMRPLCWELRNHPFEPPLNLTPQYFNFCIGSHFMCLALELIHCTVSRPYYSSSKQRSSMVYDRAHRLNCKSGLPYRLRTQQLWSNPTDGLPGIPRLLRLHSLSVWQRIVMLSTDFARHIFAQSQSSPAQAPHNHASA